MLLAWAPIVRGGNRHVALILLEWLALAVLLTLLARYLGQLPRTPGTIDSGSPSGRVARTAVVVLALAPLWFAVFQLIPLPSVLWSALPGHGTYAESLAEVGLPSPAYRASSLAPDLTVLSLMAGLPLSATLLLGHLSPAPQLRILIHALAGFAVLQAVIGLLQLGPFGGLYFGAPVGGRAIGTFANPNHFANYIAMTVPLVVLLFRQATTSPRRDAGERRGRQPLAVLWGIVLFLLLAAILASGSRGGTVTALVVTVLAVMLLGRRSGHRREKRWRIAGVAALLLLVAVAVGVDTLLARFDGDKTGYFAGDRWQMVLSSWRAGLLFWPLGSGLGTFASVFPAFHPVGLRGFVEHAHNDYIQLLMEGGLLAVALAVVALWLVVRQTFVMVRRAQQTGLDSSALLQASCGLGLLAVILHSWVDFNLRIPANAMLAAFLLGVFLRPLDAPASRT